MKVNTNDATTPVPYSTEKTQKGFIQCLMKLFWQTVSTSTNTNIGHERHQVKGKKLYDLANFNNSEIETNQPLQRSVSDIFIYLIALITNHNTQVQNQNISVKNTSCVMMHNLDMRNTLQNGNYQQQHAIMTRDSEKLPELTLSKTIQKRSIYSDYSHQKRKKDLRSRTNIMLSFYLTHSSILQVSNPMDISTDEIVSLASHLFSEPKRKLAFVREIQTTKNYYGELSSEILSDRHQNNIIFQWIFYSLYSMPIESFVIKEFVAHSKKTGKNNEPFTLQNVREHVIKKLSRLTKYNSSNNIVEHCMEYIKNNMFPIFYYNDEHHNSLKVDDFEWGIKNAGLLYVLSFGLDVRTVTPQQAEDIGKILMMQLSNNYIDFLLRSFLLPGTLYYAKQYPAVVQQYEEGSYEGIQYLALKTYIDKYKSIQNNNDLILHYKKQLNKLKTRNEIAREVIDERCPEADLNVYLDGRENYCGLPSINKIYEKHVGDFVSEFYKVDKLLFFFLI